MWVIIKEINKGKGKGEIGVGKGRKEGWGRGQKLRKGMQEG